MVGQETYNYNKIFLRFPEKATEQSFRIFSFSYDRQAFQVMAIAAIVVNLVLVLSDYSKIGQWEGPLLMRGCLSVILFGGYLLSKQFKPEQHRGFQEALLLIDFIFIYSYFIGMSLIPYHAYTFPNSVISVVFFVVTMGGLRFLNAMIFLAAIEISYFIFVYVISPNDFWMSQSVAILVNGALSMAVAYLIERARRNIFIKNQIVYQQKEELETADALKNKLFSILSHDLRGPLNKLIAMVDMSRKEHITAEEFKVHTARLEGEMRNTASFMENMLYWSKSLMQGFEVRQKKVDIKELLDHNIMAFADAIAAKNIHLSIDVRENTAILADEEMLSISLRNILSNAIKFTPKGGTISAGQRVGDDYVELFITDNGIGIDEEKQKDLFSIKNISTPGTEGEKGTGLGLYLIREFTEKNGGQIAVESKPGKGSTFSLRFPKNGFAVL
ncbi:MAG: HAMP domain-containing sensor histidine kinase [Cyclobacteriaceae bacterium]|nr:HAMP domain-containing sensor histidine kinase [Cyclobacteriaceae bacterium]